MQVYGEQKAPSVQLIAVGEHLLYISAAILIKYLVYGHWL